MTRENITIRFHGVRGSIATPGSSTAAVGGNTSCVEVSAGDTRIVLDAGTGLRTLGNELAASGPSTTNILLSHVHWDHIQGIPFFAPLYIPGHAVNIMSPPNGLISLEEVLRLQMSPPVFPVSLDEVREQLSLRDLRARDRFRIDDALITVAKLNHPDPVYAFRIEIGGRAIVYATDTEHFSVVDPTLAKLCEGADIVIYDAMYTPEEYPAKLGWGHSTYAAGAELMRHAGAEMLILFHHDPGRSDDDIADIELRARECYENTRAAREGMTLLLEGLARHDGLDRRRAA